AATGSWRPPSPWPTSSSKELPAMGFETLVLAREETFAIVTLNRPPANAISEPLIRELNDALNSVRDDDAVRSVIITGAGDKIFCGGADLGSAFSGARVSAAAPGQPALQGERDARRREGAGAPARQARAAGDGRHHQGRRRGPGSADGQIDRYRAGGLHADAAQRGRGRGNPGVLR